jgi:hypothetical protein
MSRTWVALLLEPPVSGLIIGLLLYAGYVIQELLLKWREKKAD